MLCKIFEISSSFQIRKNVSEIVATSRVKAKNVNFSLTRKSEFSISRFLPFQSAIFKQVLQEPRLEVLQQSHSDSLTLVYFDNQATQTSEIWRTIWNHNFYKNQNYPWRLILTGAKFINHIFVHNSLMLTVMMLKFVMNLVNIIMKNTSKFQVPSSSPSKDISVSIF